MSYSIQLRRYSLLAGVVVGQSFLSSPAHFFILMLLMTYTYFGERGWVFVCCWCVYLSVTIPFPVITGPSNLICYMYIQFIVLLFGTKIYDAKVGQQVCGKPPSQRSSCNHQPIYRMTTIWRECIYLRALLSCNAVGESIFLDRPPCQLTTWNLSGVKKSANGASPIGGEKCQVERFPSG